MRRKTSLPEQKNEMDMTPMIDVTFLLLIFFMCTLKFKTLEGRLAAHLPKDVGANIDDAERPEEVDVRLVLIAPGTRLDPRTDRAWSGERGTRYEFGSDRRIEYAVGPRRCTSIASVEARLDELRAADPERQAVLAPDAGIVNAEVVEVLDAMLDCGFAEVRLEGAATHD